MNIANVKAAKAVALDVVRLCERYEAEQAKSDKDHDDRGSFSMLVGSTKRKPFHPSITGTLPASLKRRSMDLTRTLAEMRRSW